MICNKCGFTEPCANCIYEGRTKIKPLKFKPTKEEPGTGNIWMNNYDRMNDGSRRRGR